MPIPCRPTSNADSAWTRASSRRRVVRRAVFAAVPALTLLRTAPAFAASLTGPVSGWAHGVPSYISMYEYVPAKLAPNPPILVVSHFCSGTAAGVFGEAQAGGIVAAADQLGFLMIFPQTSNNCWDVGTPASLTHDGGGDTQAIAEMVAYEITTRGADPNRVYATGTSSGAMMTEALLAVYPDVFKAGAEFSGVPAGCWSVSDPTGQWSGPCADGTVSNTAQEWGDMVRAMDKGYSGYRPRIQLWHGTADMTINYNNQTEAIKEWTNVLGLNASPTSTTSITFNSHQWTRESWQDGCGFTVLEAWSEQNGPHGTDANLNATYVIPFLALDETGAVDPQVTECGDAGGPAGGSGGAAEGGAGADASRGSSSGGGSGANGGSRGAEGGASTGSSGSSGGNGGSAGTAGSSSSSSGGSVAGGGSNGGSGAIGTMSGAAGTGGGGANGTNGTSGTSGTENASPHSGSGCSVTGAEDGSGGAMALAAIVVGVGRGARRRRRG